MLTPDGNGVRLQHVSIEVGDLERSVGFYQGLGLRLLREPVRLPGRRVAWFELGEGQELHLIQSDGSGVDHEIDSRKGHFAISVLGDYAEASKRLEESFPKGLVAEGGAVFHGQHYFTDPDGNLIEVNKRREEQKGESV